MENIVVIGLRELLPLFGAYELFLSGLLNMFFRL